MTKEQSMDNEMRNCADVCTECASTCFETIAQCLDMGGKHAERSHITTLQLCADICQVSARAMLLGSELHMHTCRACAEICDACAEECESMGGSIMDKCAEICVRCADSCREMAGNSTDEKAA